MAALARPRPLFPTRFYLLHPWSRVLRGTCTSRQLLLRCSTFLLPGRSQVQWRKCNRIVGRFCASRQLLLDRCSRRGSNSATAPCVALPPASLQSSSVHGVVHCSNFRHPCRSPAPATLVHPCTSEQSLPCTSGQSLPNVRYGRYTAAYASYLRHGLLGQVPSIESQTFFWQRRDRRAEIYCD